MGRNAVYRYGNARSVSGDTVRSEPFKFSKIKERKNGESRTYHPYR